MFETRIITLENAKDRHARLKENLIGFTYSFSKGYSSKDVSFDGSTVVFDQGSLPLNQTEFIKDTGRRWFRFGEVGAFIAHYVLWKEMVDKEIDSMLILEDDVTLSSSFNMRNMKELMSLVSSSNTVDFCYLQKTCPHGIKKSEQFKPLFDSVSNDTKIILLDSSVSFFGYQAFLVGATAYALSLNGAKKLKQYAEENGFSGPIDNFIPKAASRGVVQISVPFEIDDYFDIDMETGSQDKSQTHSGRFCKEERIGDLFIQYREHEEVVYA